MSLIIVHMYFGAKKFAVGKGNAGNLISVRPDSRQNVL